jgi:TonB family protein
VSERPSLRVVAPARSIARKVEPVWQPDVDEPGWCVDATITGCSIGEREASTIPSEERRAALRTRGRERAQAVLARPDERAPARPRRAGVIGVSVAIHVVGFVLLAWFGEGVETRVARRGGEPFTNERVIVPIEVPARAIEPELAAEPEPEIESVEPRALPAKSHHRHAASPSSAEPELAGPSEPSSYALHGFELSSEGALPGGSGHGDAWGSGDEGHGSGAGAPGDSGSSNVAPDVQAKPRGTVVEPDYPPELERRGIEGDAVVLVWLDEHGHVIKAEVVESSGYEAFDHNAEMAAQRQAWNPAMRAGEPIASKRRYRIRFKLPTP